MADAQPVSAGDLAVRTNTHECYVREWLNTQAAGGVLSTGCTVIDAEDLYQRRRFRRLAAD